MWYASFPAKLHRVMHGYYNVKDFGLKGDRTTDNTQALQNLIDLVADEGGGVIYFPVGYYRISDSITLWSGVRLVGAGRYGSEICADTPGPTIHALAEDSGIEEMRFGNVTVTIGSTEFEIIPLGFVLRNCVFYGTPSQPFLTIYTGTVDPWHTGVLGVLCENIRFECFPEGSGGAIALYGYGPSLAIMRNIGITREEDITNWTAIYIHGCAARIEGLWVNDRGVGENTTIELNGGSLEILNATVKYVNGTKKFLHISNGAPVILGHINEYLEDCEYTRLSGDLSRVRYLTHLGTRAASPDGATGLRLPTDRYTNSTEYVTLKSFRTGIEGEFRIRIEGYNDDPEYNASVRVRKNYAQVREWTIGPDSSFTLEHAIAVNRGDLIEVQAKKVGGINYVVINNVIATHLFYEPFSYYDLVD